MQELPGSIAGPPDTDGKLKDISIPNGNILLGSWRIWLPLCIGILTLTFLTLARKFKYGSWLFSLFAFALLFLMLQGVFSHLGTSSRGDGLDWNTSLFFFFSSHQSLCCLITLPALFLSLFWYEQGTEQFE